MVVSPAEWHERVWPAGKLTMWCFACSQQKGTNDKTPTILKSHYSKKKLWDMVYLKTKILLGMKLWQIKHINDQLHFSSQIIIIKSLVKFMDISSFGTW